ncbi:Holliday junction resolvase RecU [Edaphobacillus lindanitolerans]|uniref:Holliday junction resolvase RecU n=1 Tax=Edaphobacillus lindanitolerans TaxID=550447 RepID=A0A1U7PKY2_9BACI|nr:Holliday junction resolvase RecU [Edaphobacillus lindanitolerans]SIT66265.1 recombination protein U [Edaphobacillus lindanitolerans]
MAIRYPGGRRYSPPEQPKNKVPKKDYSFSNRGKTLEDELDESNAFYLANKIAVIHKKPVPVQVVKVDYPSRSAAVIREAYFKTPSTTDYNGIYNGRHIDFDAKETGIATSFPLKNIHAHQVEHMKSVTEQGGTAFLIVKFTVSGRYFAVPFDLVERAWERMESGGRKSIPLAELEEEAVEFKAGYLPRLDYLKAVSRFGIS